MESASLASVYPHSSIFPRRVGSATPKRFQLYPTLSLLPIRLHSDSPQEGEYLVNASPQNWGGTKGGALIRNYYRDNFNAGVDEDEEEYDDDDDDDEDRSLDLLARFVETLFKKISRKARKSVRSVLPFRISTKLVGFSVNGVLILTFLWVLKALLEVICTLGSVVFISILAIRGIWSGISYLQENRSHRGRGYDDTAWSGTQPA